MQPHVYVGVCVLTTVQSTHPSLVGNMYTLGLLLIKICLYNYWKVIMQSYIDTWGMEEREMKGFR